LLALASPVPGGGGDAISSTMVFQSPHEPHLPAQRAEIAPQLWQTKLDFAALAISHAPPPV
jgi:hypothetical protein